jgi:Xaa-Pro aminopeptidase
VVNSYFSRKEYEQRHARAVEQMKARGISALFLTNDGNIYYLAGQQRVAPGKFETRPEALIITVDKPPVLLIHETWKSGAKKNTWVSDVRGYEGMEGLPTDMLVSLFQELGIAKGRVGIELGLEQRLGQPTGDLLKQQQALPGVEWVDAADLLWQLRLIKSQAEIECLRKSCSAVMHAFETVFPKLSPGLTQEQIVHMLQGGITDAGADFGFIIPCFDPDTYVAQSAMPSNKPVEKGAMVWIDMGAMYHGYWCDFCRAASLGKPSAETLRTWEAVHRTTMAGVKAVKPGATFSQLVQAIAAEGERQGLDMSFTAEAGRLGHGLGLHLAEPPSVTLDNHAVLQPGMAITLEPGVIRRSGMFCIEQNMVVTEDGVDVLTEGPWEIWVV